MRYRVSTYRYTIAVGSAANWLGELWAVDRPRPLAHARWRPDADVYETAAALEVLVDLAGVDEHELEVHLFEDALVVEGCRQLPACQEGALYHAAGIRQGPFRLALPVPVPVDAERVEARYERGVLRITLPKRGGTR